MATRFAFMLQNGMIVSCTPGKATAISNELKRSNYPELDIKHTIIASSDYRSGISLRIDDRAGDIYINSNDGVKTLTDNLFAIMKEKENETNKD